MYLFKLINIYIHVISIICMQRLLISQNFAPHINSQDESQGGCETYNRPLNCSEELSRLRINHNLIINTAIETVREKAKRKRLTQSQPSLSRWLGYDKRSASKRKPCAFSTSSRLGSVT
jgi:hypothetical protein